MTTLQLATTRLTGHDDDPELPLLVVGPSLGTSVEALWTPVAHRLTGTYRVVGWDLPGHGRSAPAPGFSVAELAEAVLSVVDDETFAYAGDSLGAAVGLQLLLDAPERVNAATLCCTGPRIGTPQGWHDRARDIRSHGTSTLLEAAPGRWFGPGFERRQPDRAARLLADLASADPDSYAAACDALSDFDLRSRLADITVPVLAVAGDADAVTPPASLRHIAGGVPNGRLVVLTAVGHLAPAEAPEQVAALLAAGAEWSPSPTGPTRAAGMRVRREVLGDAHVDRASAAASELTHEFQDLITTYAWGSVWTRPGLDRRSRSMITLTALIARGHHDELAMHLRAALTNGLTRDEVKEVVLHSAIYCGVPDANTAFRILQQVYAQLDEDLDESKEN